MILDEVDPRARLVLEQFGFDPDEFERLRRLVVDGDLSTLTNAVGGVVEPLQPGDWISLPARGAPGFAAALEAGVEALQGGSVASIVLAGGMATRFGGVVKGVVEAIDGRSFLELKLADTARLAAELRTEIPVALMTSFATDEITRAFVSRLDVPAPLVFSQFVAPRLRPDGSLFRDRSGDVSLYGPGHGDLLEAVRRSGTAADLRARGIRHVVVSNVDNLGARVDPVVIGAHILGSRPYTAEVAHKDGDTGGAPVRVDGKPRLLEGMCFPVGFDHDSTPLFNTNTAVIDLAALERPVELTWLVIEKDVGGEPAVQLERLYHELTAFVETTFLAVPRARFVPIKVPDDLERARPILRRILADSPLAGP